MKKYFYLAAVSAMMLTACSSDNDVVQPTPEPNTTPQVAVQQQAVAFDTYLSGTTASTRSGQTDVMTNSTLQTTGFGVFASLSNDANYASTIGPNFMYNQKVTYAAPGWTYDPVKYWPNETFADMHNTTGHASSTARDKLSFFAYAPYVASTATTGAVTATAIIDTNNESTPGAIANVGITGMSANTIISPATAFTDPTISYQMAYTPSKSVDLLWGVAPAGNLQYTAVDNTSFDIGEGEPLLNLIKPSKDEKIKFLFKHALARLGLKVVAAVDQLTPGGNLHTATKIYVNSVTIEDGAATATLAPTGTLNLNNGTAGVANWTLGTKEKFKLVINGSREINSAITSSGTGVTTTAQDVIDGGKYFMIIPTHGTQATFKVTIDYDVVTTDANLNGGKSTVNNVIWKNIVVGDGTDGFTNNKAYTLKLILGMTSVKLDAEVADWEDAGSTPVDLPQNYAE